MGEYLQWFYRALVAGAPSTVRIVHHPTSAVDLVNAGGGEEVHLADGRVLNVDHVVVTSGHTANQPPAEGAHPRVMSPYPVKPYVKGLPVGSNVDVVTALTVGRGGKFVEDGNRLRYQRSGREPIVHMFSRSGLPFTAKTVTGIDRTDVYKPIICTPEALDALSGRSNGHRRLVDVRRELLPLLFAEMYARYYAQVAYQQAGSAAAGAAVRERLRRSWREGRFDDERAALSARFGSFDAEALFFGHQPKYDSSEDYARFLYKAIEDDLREAEVPDGASPVKSAADVFRIFRDPMLSLDSYRDFNAAIRSRIHRLVAGPPALRSRQLLALMDAGVLRTPFGPAPTTSPKMNGRVLTRISSSAFVRSHVTDVDVVISGHLDEPRIDGSASELLARLYRRGRVRQFRYGSVTVGSVDLTPHSHPINSDGQPQERLWMFGVLTEGFRHFTHYIPSPRSRIRAFEELGACVGEILD
jgi:FAD-NAD(P)-binding